MDASGHGQGNCRVTPEPAIGYRPCVGIFLLSADGRVLIGQRSDIGEPAWQLPQGGIDPGEEPVAAAWREMREEIGTDRATLLRVSPVWRAYDLPRELLRPSWRGRWRGQTQLWVAFRFEGEAGDVALDGEHPEFVAWRWEDPERIAELVVPFKRDVYRSVVEEFRSLRP